MAFAVPWLLCPAARRHRPTVRRRCAPPDRVAQPPGAATAGAGKVRWVAIARSAWITGVSQLVGGGDVVVVAVHDHVPDQGGTGRQRAEPRVGVDVTSTGGGDHLAFLRDPRHVVVGRGPMVNERVKHREWFRPFAPSVLDDRGHELFTDYRSSPFMLMVEGVRPERRRDIPAVTHVDGTGRVQSVTPALHPVACST